MKSEHYNQVDVVIIGGGVAGCIAAIALSQYYSVALIDKLTEPVERIGECLAPAARRILKQLDLLTGLEKQLSATQQKIQLNSIGTQSYWGTDRCYVVDHMRNPDGLAWHLDRPAFETYLRNAAIQRGVHCLWGAKLQQCHYQSPHWHIAVEELHQQKRHQIKAKFVIDASGRQAHFVRKIGVERTHFDKLIACWATMPNREENKMSTISASEIGWWYSAPLPNNKRVLALQTDSDLIDRADIKDSHSFLQLANTNREMAKLLEKNQEQIHFQGTVSANSTRLNQVVGQQWAALGDAAISFDPLSSQGMFNAMATALQLAELIQASGILENPFAEKTEQFQKTYSHQIDQIWEHYLKHKSIYYREERRWQKADFWKRRH
jgi:flavin-dependent dehydrogenase